MRGSVPELILSLFLRRELKKNKFLKENARGMGTLVKIICN